MIVSDSSSIILLAKTGVLEAMLENNILSIPEKVHEESVTRALEAGRPDAYIINDAITHRRIIVVQAKRKTAERIARLFGITAGENEVVSVAVDDKADLVLSDDKKCMRVCAALKIPCASTADIIVSLYHKKHLTKEKARASLEQLKDMGWYKKDIIDKKLEVII